MIIRLIRWIISRLTMVYVTSYFIDMETNKYINIYIDYYNQQWLACNKYSYRINYNEDRLDNKNKNKILGRRKQIEKTQL